MSILIILLIQVMFTGRALADSYALDEKVTITIQPPKHWDILQKKMRAPIMFVGPDVKSSRFHSVLDIFPIDSLPPELLNAEKFEGFIKEFEKGKRDWVSEKEGSFETMFPYEKLSWKSAPLVHKFKFSYQIEDGEFIEESFYFVCNEIPMHAKALIPTASNVEAVEAIVIKAMSGISCKQSNKK